MHNTQIGPDASREQIVAIIRAADALVAAVAQFRNASPEMRNAARQAQWQAWGELEEWDRDNRTK